MIPSIFLIFFASLIAGILFLINSACKLIISFVEEGWDALVITIKAALVGVTAYAVCYLVYGLMAWEFFYYLNKLFTMFFHAVFVIVVVIIIAAILGRYINNFFDDHGLDVYDIGIFTIFMYLGYFIEFIGRITEKGFISLLNLINKKSEALADGIPKITDKRTHEQEERNE